MSLHLGELLFVVLAIGLPVMLLFGRPYFRHWMAMQEKRLESETRLAAEKAARYATSNADLEQRLRVIEQIVTDGGMQTAAQIEALRPPRLSAVHHATN